ncbi:aminotransferase class I/II-fold pyridoxal phosphate-dependent enzyme [Microlunatus antarcticus]|uniref:Lysine decarboxylase n=1 Tax=Microlunatus antarcticus TaxID=53388 RepID=A0A7W5JTD6_9ACTN|nr:aminotransferase class V-fold PLP-dependent enzyme [Microlunatus antarcticus]MBB3325706.1 lysine decarboxylase [Microlunatus antarcticus]
MGAFEDLVRGEAPLLDAYLTALDGDATPFTIPGHKRSAAFGRVVAGDVPLHGGLDSIGLTGGLLVEAERRAAALWGADVARFSVAGSTHGNQALALAVGRPGDRVVVPRTLHRSLLLGLVLAGLEPVWLPTRVDPGSGLPLGCRRDDVEQCLRDHPDVVAVFVGDPTYVGTVGELAAVAELVHAAGLPLLVDAAWGAHFGFHPALPAHALQAGADALVMSAHKMLPAYSQAALVLARTERLDPARLQAAFDATHTTSPAGALLASLDAARALLQLDGEAQLDRPVRLVAAARARLREVPGLTVLEAAEATRLVVGLAGTGADGVVVGRELRAAGVEVELADRDWLIPVVTLADTEDTVDRLVVALVAAVRRHLGPPRERAVAASWSVRPEIVMPPRDAFFARATTLGVDEAVGRVSAELVAPYPPGVPVLAPGERITAEAVASLQAAARAGTRIAYAADPTMATLRVVA